MDEHPPELRALLEAAREEHEPSPADQQRVGRALGAALGVTVGVGAGHAAGQAAVQAAGQAATGAKLAMGLSASMAGKLLAAVGMGAALYWGFAPTKPAPSVPRAADAHVEVERPVVSPPHVSPEPVPDEVPALEVPSEAPLTPTNVPARRSAASPRADGAGAELALMRQAMAAVRDGQASRALSLLDVHGERFPHGVLLEEREGLRVIALCAVGRIEQGRAAQAAFLKNAGRSPMTGRVRAACPPTGVGDL